MAGNTGSGISIPVEKTEPSTTENSRLFTEEEVNKIRQQEKDKLYKRIEESDSRTKTMEEQLAILTQEREAAIKEAEERARKEAELQRQRELEELSTKELLSRKEDEWNSRINQVEQEWQQKFQTLEQQRQMQEAVLEKEREMQALETYRHRRMSEEQENIIPQLLDLVNGNTPEEVEASIEALRARSSAIIEEVQAVQQPRNLRSAPITAPPVGPLDNQMEYQTFSTDDIRNMPMDQYAKMRDRLLNAARPTRGRF